MLAFTLLTISVLSAVAVSIVDPVDGGTYIAGWLPLRAIVENENVLPDSVHYTLNGGPAVQLIRLSTDWPTYMQNNQNNGYSQSPAPMTSEVLWTAPVCETLHVFENPTVVNGVVYQVGRLSVYALDEATGQEIWSYPIGGHDDPPSYVDGRLYVQGQDSVYCLDANSGERIWAFHGPTADGGTPCVLEGRVACAGYYPSPGHTTVYGLSASDGQLEWSTVISGIIGNCMASWNGLFFVGTLEGPLTAIDAATGQIVWSHTITEGGYWDTSPTIVDGKIYIGGWDGAVHRFDALTGALEWETHVSEFCVEPTPAVFEDMIICGAIAPSDSSVFALRMSDGSKVWAIPGSLHGSSAVADGVVFWGGLEEPYDLINAADAATGEIIWQYDPSPGDWGLQGTPAITDGVMYFPSTDGNLYAFGTGLKWTYQADLFTEIGASELIVTSFESGIPVAADTVSFTVTGTGIDINTGEELSLAAGPNPFMSATTVSFELHDSEYTSVLMYDLTGREVAMLYEGELLQGTHSLNWNGIDDKGQPLSSGLYLCRLQSGGIHETVGVVLLR